MLGPCELGFRSSAAFAFCTLLQAGNSTFALLCLGGLIHLNVRVGGSHCFQNVGQQQSCTAFWLTFKVYDLPTGRGSPPSTKLKRRVCSEMSLRATFAAGTGDPLFFRMLAVLREDCALQARAPQCSITDAKSLYHSMKGNPTSRQDRRTSVELALIGKAIEEPPQISCAPCPPPPAPSQSNKTTSCQIAAPRPING